MIRDLEIILDILFDVIYKGKKSTDRLNKIENKDADISYITKLVYGVLENKLYLEYMIGKLSKVRLKKIHKEVLLILEIGIYNIFFLDKKDYAVVNELVELTKKRNKRSASFVNAILRNFIRNEKEISKIKESNDLKALSIRFSIPLDILEYLSTYYPYDYVKEFAKSINKEEMISIRVNRMKIDIEGLKERLQKQGFVLEDSKISTNALKVSNPKGLVDTKEFKEGFFTIQSEASMKTVEVLDPKGNSYILDLCAAPGTKTTYIGEYTNDKAKILANDISESKNYLIRENIERIGLNNIIITNFDSARLKEDYIEKFDYVLCDAPCSGLGVMGKKPEIRYNRNIEDIKSLSKLQRDILDKAVKYLKKGAILVYSTCTLGYEENIKNFNYLKGLKELKNCPITGKEYLEYANHIDHTDGFFIAKFEKKWYERNYKRQKYRSTGKNLWGKRI